MPGVTPKMVPRQKVCFLLVIVIPCVRIISVCIKKYQQWCGVEEEGRAGDEGEASWAHGASGKHG